MITGAKVIRKYEIADSGKRIDIICKYYPCFMDIVDNFIEDMEEDIKEEQDYNRRAELGDLGVRVQTSGLSNPTQRDGVRHSALHTAILTGDFSGGELDGVSNVEEYLQDAALVRVMIDDYSKFEKRVKELVPRDKELFVAYLKQETSFMDIAESGGIQYESAKQKVRRIKVNIKEQIYRKKNRRG